jgi:hypothetical protein
MMRRPPSARVASVGVTQTSLAVEETLRWLFREQPTDDYGIDAQVEIVDGTEVLGRLLALQIKGGMSWFSEEGPGGWWFRPSTAHVRYWSAHSLPVVVVLYEPEKRECYWQIINSNTLVKTTTGGWRVLVPKSQILNEEARGPLREAAGGDAYVLRIRELQLARPWMNLLTQGARLIVDIEEWVNKTSGRGAIKLSVDYEDGQLPIEIASWGVFLGLKDYAEVVPKMFAWADVGIHEETYAEPDYGHYGAECVYYDNEGDRIVLEDYDEWRNRRRSTGLRPYKNPSGEVDFWRLELSLGELGKSFLLVDEFATNGIRQLAQ